MSEYSLVLVAHFHNSLKKNREIPFRWEPTKREAADAVRRFANEFGTRPSKVVVARRKHTVMEENFFTLDTSSEELI